MAPETDVHRKQKDFCSETLPQTFMLVKKIKRFLGYLAQTDRLKLLIGQKRGRRY